MKTVKEIIIRRWVALRTQVQAGFLRLIGRPTQPPLNPPVNGGRFRSPFPVHGETAGTVRSDSSSPLPVHGEGPGVGAKGEGETAAWLRQRSQSFEPRPAFMAASRRRLMARLQQHSSDIFLWQVIGQFNNRVRSGNRHGFLLFSN